jgi:hypothetical protein
MSGDWCLCWSARQNALHIETVLRHVEANRTALRSGTIGDYRILAIGTREEVEAAADVARPIIIRRDEARQAEDVWTGVLL